MCQNKRYITTRQGKRLLVNCGHCPACLQEKAISRTNRIRANDPKDGSIMTLFVTLTYRNSACPYIDKRELECSSPHSFLVGCDEEGRDKYEWFKTISVYRNIKARRDYKCGFKYGKQILADVSIPYPDDAIYNLPTMVNDKHDRISVCYYPDVQLFFKRLRQILKRNYNYEKRFSYYACSEYGSVTKRSHFHLLLFVPRGSFEMWQSAIAAAWPFDGYGLTKRNIEIARNAASYVSSYVNCITTIPSLFQKNAFFRPKHSYSKGFGQALSYLQLPQIIEAYQRGDLHVNITRIRNNTLVVDSVLLPKYIICREFPKFKGFSRLTFDEIIGILRAPQSLNRYVEVLGYDRQQLKDIKTRLTNLKQRALSKGVDLFDWYNTYAGIYTLRASQVLRDWYSELETPDDYFLNYDNIADYYDGFVHSPTLDNLLPSLSASFEPISDPNMLPYNCARSRQLEYWFNKYDKARKVNNNIYSSNNFHF